MKPLFLLFITILTGLGACVNKDKLPDDILSQEKMKLVLWDLARSDQFVTDFVSKDSNLNKKQESLRLYEEVFALHQIKREEFRKSLDYYRMHPDLLRVVMDSLNTMARRKEQEAYKIEEDTTTKPATSPVPDSTRFRTKSIRKKLDSLSLPIQPQ
ncbi:MAG: DUF4296 domain-containing protein [Chitinophagales bacterium]|nr:DUF4296 domain-containing protein [Chitinophagales bacterium]